MVARAELLDYLTVTARVNNLVVIELMLEAFQRLRSHHRIIVRTKLVIKPSKLRCLKIFAIRMIVSLLQN